MTPGVRLSLTGVSGAGRAHAGVVDRVVAADRGTEQLPLVRHAPGESEDDPAVLRRERLERRRQRVPGADRPGRLAGGEVAHEGVLQDGDLAVEHTYVNHLPPAASLTLVQRREQADGG